MTWSIVAKDMKTGHLGIAVATCSFAVGARVPFVKSGVGAIATQAFVNPYYGYRGLEMLQAGVAATDIIEQLTRADEGRDLRQVHILAADGGIAAYTGARCVPWCGHMIADTFSVAGNMLAGHEVVSDTARVFAENEFLPFAQRFLLAMKSGEDAGGDKRGKQSAALVIYDGEEYPLLDIRVDDHPDPLAELTRLEGVSRGRYLHYRKYMPSTEHPYGVTDRDELERRIAEDMSTDDFDSPDNDPGV